MNHEHNLIAVEIKEAEQLNLPHECHQKIVNFEEMSTNLLSPLKIHAKRNSSCSFNSQQLHHQHRHTTDPILISETLLCLPAVAVVVVDYKHFIFLLLQVPVPLRNLVECDDNHMHRSTHTDRQQTASSSEKVMSRMKIKTC